MASSPLQNRVVGTVIVVALAVIILPDLFGNAGQTQHDDFQITPLSPSIDSTMKSPDFPPEFSTAGQVSDNSIQVPIYDNDDNIEVAPVAPVEVIDEVSEAQLEPDATGERWIIQLGAFRNEKRVTELLEQLKEAGFPAHSRVMRREGGPLHLLLVGPDLNEKSLAEQLPALKKLTSLEGKVVPYRPGNN